ncbi:hypothetical protein PF005_g7413 [Phytophthora fragariae]|uniref:C2H2-type domain-containing protein n=1 Tax=Phytophthora fragariae TaxID=53985 RepID=A0A6A3UBG6_9STRA|nr:hypothetical protein PF003_g29232 [Phytophthora fragariae]KAE8941996.1 hypothetical protein PF009_g8238 [Phytophthora fragariae]KAE9019000.1 hypothetical protein PF011_g6021 [Phytophthora fragariae]KAE9122486.1 hypothetical protein PF007_g7430 [Phytophthora fragariae]KAE9122831.1 hypothetical protein PF010_g6614 [Phytophthora fragariae]
MDLDAGADDFFAALNNGDAEDVFAGFGAAEAEASAASATGSRPSLDDEPLVMVDKRKKAEAAKKAARKEAAARAAAAAKAARQADEPALPMEERIVNLLVPELKVNDVMLLIRKMKQAGKSDADEFSELDAEQKTAPRFRCETCGNTEQNNFITDYARGDTICNGVDGNGCGTVVQDHIVHEGSAYRKFEGEEDKSHHGPAPNKLFSTGHNLRTLISQDGEMAGNLRRAAEFVEMNLSQMGKDERRTRIGYKDQMKQKACRLIDHTISNLDLHEIVGSRAKKMFAEFRDVREHVHQFDAMVAGCVIAAYMETGKEMYSAQNSIRIDQNKQAGIANLALLPNKAVDEKKLHPFTCPLCDMKFNARRGMQFHKCAGKPDEDKEKSLNTTDLAPVVLPDELQPIIEMKNGKKWFKCPVCSRVYGKEESLSEHMVRHQNQSKKRKYHIETSTIDSTRLTKTTKLASANPSVQVNTHEQVMFRGEGRRVWLQHLTED